MRPVSHQVAAAQDDGGIATGFQFRLSAGSEAPPAASQAPVAAASPVPQSDVQQVLDRLPALTVTPTDTQEFALPKESLPPPRPGKTVDVSFPPSTTVEAPSQAPAGPVEVVRYSPEGDVPLAPYLSLTFSEPMVALTSHEDLAAQDVPVTLSPSITGTWRWVGTKTLMFEAKGSAGPGGDRLPMATQYTATVPAGTTSANGGKVAKAVTWRFTTPPPQVKTSYPGDSPQRRDALMFVAFDQRIDPDSVLPSVSVKAGGKTYALRLASAEEVKADSSVQGLADAAGAGRWLAFRANEAFPSDTDVTVTLGPGTPSAEGPLKTDKAQTFSFHTYGPLRIEESRCGWNNQCPPFSPWYIRFSNPLDARAFDDSLVRIEPSLPGAHITAFGTNLTIQGSTAGRTTYQVTLSAALKDQFGQTLGRDQTLTFKVDSAPPTLSAARDNFVVLDPTSKPAFAVFSINYARLKVQAYAVGPEHWAAYRTYRQTYYQNPSGSTPPGRLVMSQTVQVNGKADELAETDIDLGPALKDGLGHVIVVVQPDPGGGLFSGLFRQGNQQLPVVQAWVESSRIGLDAFVDHDTMLAWANSLVDGSPLDGVELTLTGANKSATTGADGLAKLPLPAASAAQLLVARKGADLAILPQNQYYWGGDDGWRQRQVNDSLRWLVFDDRGMYRPGEEVHVKGWIRRVGGTQLGDVGPLQGEASQVAYRLTDAQGNDVRTGSFTVNALGGFDGSFTLPDGMNLGMASLQLTAQGSGNVDGRDFQHPIQVQEFRRPEFEVSASAAEGPFFVGGSAVTTVKATYYAGGPLPNADVRWEVSSRPGSFTPPNWDEFTFGTWRPWWVSWASPDVSPSASKVFTGTTDAAGEHQMKIDFQSVDPPQATSLVAQATVMDVNRQAWTAETTLLVHPADLYVGLRTERMFVQRNDPLKVDAIVVDLDGKAVAGRSIAMRAARLDWKYQPTGDGSGGSSWQEVEVAVQPCTVQSAATPVTCTFETGEGGTYRITAVIEDEQGRKNQTQITRWVSGGNRPPEREITQETVQLVPDRKEYRPGDTAEILVQSPFYPAEGVLTLRRSGIVTSERFTMQESSYTVKVPIQEGYTPNVQVQIDLVGSAARTDDKGNVDTKLAKRPAYASGSLDLSVPPLSRTLSLDVTPRDKALEPGGQTTLDVVLKDAAGKPVEGGELAVVVVDEAVLALSDYKLPDPLATFYSSRSPDVEDYHLRSSVLLANPETLALEAGTRTAEEAMPMAAAAAPTGAPAAPSMQRAMKDAAGSAAQPPQPAIAVRTDFNALATFAPAVATDKDGKAQIAIKLPDNLTRYRVMVVAVADGKQFGAAESAITARLPLMVRASPPRFLNFGDRFELPVVVQNQTDTPMTVTVVARATNVALTAGQGRLLTVPANDRREVRFPASTMQAGTARFQVGAVAGKWSDAAQFELPVWTPATTEAFATYGQIDDGAIAQPVIAPSQVYTQFGGLEISTSSTALQGLTDAVLYLVAYPFECSEQLSSRIMAVAALRDVLSAFKAEGLPSPQEMEAATTRDIERLRTMQNDDGSFSFWRRGGDQYPWPYLTIYVTHALVTARNKDFKVPDEMLTNAHAYLNDIERHIPSWYGDDARHSLIAYSLYVRSLMGDRDTARARSLIAEVGLEKLPTEAVGWLLSVLTGDSDSATQVAAIRTYLNNHATETAGAASFATSYGDDDYLLLHSDRRTDAVILDALMADQPKSDLIPKVVQGLLAHRVKGRWNSTQENSFVLLALDRYFNTYEAQTPDFVARLWLGDQYAGQAQFQGRSTDRQVIDVPMSFLSATQGTQSLILNKEGTGRLYYRLGLSYAPTNLQLAPLDNGFTVERTYQAVDDPADVRHDADGSWHVKAGARVNVRVTMVAPARRYHVALVDPLPAGFEALNPALAVTGSLPQAQDPKSAARSYWWWWGPWYQHQNMRDQQVEAFTSLLWEGVYTYSYVARATTPGIFVVPPPKAEEMYSPETFGRGATDRVIVE